MSEKYRVLCVHSDICKEGEVWNGSTCVNPCEPNPCETLSNSTHECISTSWNKYECGCDDNFYWWGKDQGCRSQKYTPGVICTGLTKCFNSSAEIECPVEGAAYFGQDAQYAELGFCIPQSFSVKNVSGQNIVADNNTGLEWQPAISEEHYTWDDALDYCENLTYAGSGDWRLPTKTELLTIYDASGLSPYFKETNVVWSSSWRNEPDEAWAVSFSNGQPYRAEKDSHYNLRCVRGKKLPEANFNLSVMTNYDEIVSDSTNHLLWQGGTLPEESKNKTWQQALSYCEDLAYAGLSGWRLPNRNELISLFNDGETVPASYFPWASSELSGKFWSSSGNSYPQAFAVDFYEVTVSYENNGNYDKNNVVCVHSNVCEEGKSWNGTSCVNNPCDPNPCGNDANSDGICTVADSSTHICGCKSGYFWDGAECATPCEPNPCENDANSEGTCTALNLTAYTCDCKSGYFWDDTECASPCDPNPCGNFDHSDNICTVISNTTYSCGCESGYYWWGMAAGCTGKPTLGNICTNQNNCYNNSSNITCPAEGEDFYGQEAQYALLGYCIPQSFNVTEQNVVLDSNTGLMWQQQIADRTYTWTNARNYCNNLTYAGNSDWRLPSPREILTIVDNSLYEPGVNATIYPNIPIGSYLWTSREPDNSNNGRVLVTNSGAVGVQAKASLSNVMCVSGDELPKPAFSKQTINGDIVIKDSTTGLMWQKEYVSKKWQDALKYCEDSGYAGYTDWRLPNRNELASLWDYDKSGVQYSDFPNDTQNSDWWSSSTYIHTLNLGWVVNFYDYTASDLRKTVSNRVRCVR